MQVNGLKRALTAYAVLRTKLGVWISPLLSGLLIFIIRILVTAGRLLDHVFYPQLREKKLNKILVVAGNPRSGTTFMHRFLIQSGLGSGSELRQLLWPSIILQKLLSPLIPLLEKVSPAADHSAAAHKTSLTSAETDDAAIMFRYLDGFFLYGFILAWSDENLFDWFDHSKRDTSVRDYRWLESIWKRVLIQSGQSRIIPKLFSVSVKVPDFLRKFPQAKVLYLVRDPLSMIPSGMSLVTGVLNQRYGFWQQPAEKREHYLANLYRALVELLLRFHADWIGRNIDQSRVMVVPYPRMMQDFEVVMDEIFAFIGEKPEKKLLEDIRLQAESQRSWKSSHEYDLEKFGLTEAQIRQDCKEIYATFLNPETMCDINRVNR